MNAADKEEALERLGISEDIFDELYVDFVALAKEKIIDIERVSSQANWSLAGKLAHSIKGIAGNLGVKEIYEAAKLVENDVIEGKTPETIGKDIGPLKLLIAEL
jgi:HPt (histidine-containing phosphotransfer) domain-containing protein